MAATATPNVMITHERRACFGEFNRVDSSCRSQLEVMEWHPHKDEQGRYGGVHSAKECFDFINSFGFWKDTFYMTSVGGIATSIRDKPADQVICGFMAARNHNFRHYDDLLRNLPSNVSEDLARKVFFAGICAGVGRGALGLSWSHPEEGESGMCRLLRDDDAYGLYLLAYGTKEECAGAFYQNPLFSEGANSRGYLRDSRRSELRDLLRSKGCSAAQVSSASSLSDWLRIHLRSEQIISTGKLGRLSVNAFIERHQQRGSDVASYFNMFEELKDLYS